MMTNADSSQKAHSSLEMDPKHAKAGKAPAHFGEMLGGLLWGFAEATFFFIVPDVFLTFMAVRKGWREGLKVAVAALVGALLGGLLMYTWGAGAKLKVIVPFLDVIPAISREMIMHTLAALKENGTVTLLTTAFCGVPYKIPAALASHAGIALPTFFAMSVLGRGLRFALSTLAAAGIAALWRRILPAVSPLWAWAGFWALFYGVWFLLMRS